MFYHFKNLPITLNSRSLFISDAEISQEISLLSPYKLDNRISTDYLPASMYLGNLKLKYYITGSDYLKNFLYTNENQPLTGNFARLTFNQGYLSNYNISLTPNSPAEVSANINFYDKLSGNFTPSDPQNLTGTILNLYNATLTNLDTYTENALDNITQINLSYTADIKPFYKYFDTGLNIPTRADRINILERSLTSEITSDNVNPFISLSGENFGLNIALVNPYNNVTGESFGISGKISYKSLGVSANNIHSHLIKILQSHLSPIGSIGSVIIGGGLSNNITITTTADGNHPFFSSDGSLRYVDKITVGDTLIPNYNLIKLSVADRITITNTPLNILDGTLIVYTPKYNYIWPNTLNFNYPEIYCTGLSSSGSAGSIVNITGSNFYRIDNVTFGSGNAKFQIISPNYIQAILPTDATTDFIKVIASQRNKTGVTTGRFFCEPNITSFTPVTGVWKDTLTIAGVNFSGTTGVKFNGINAYSFSIDSNKLITVQTPDTGAGFAKGYITIDGSGGHDQSISKYNPQVPIYSFSPTSGVATTPVNLKLKVDSDYLYKLPTSGLNNLVAYYKMDGNSRDYIHSNHGSDVNISYSGFSKIGQSAFFNTNTSKITIPYNSDFSDIRNNFSIGAWVYSNSFSTAVFSIFRKGSLASYAYVPFFTAGNLNFRTVNGSSIIDDLTISNTLAGISDNNWCHLMFTYDRSSRQKQIYVNGTQKTGQYYFDILLSESNEESIQSHDTNSYFIDEIGIWSGALSSGDVASIYNKGIGQQPEFVSKNDFKVRFGNIDVRFNPSGYETNHPNSTGCLTGSVPFHGIDDYIYLYQPDGVSTYNPNSLKFDMIGEPQITSLTFPANGVINKYTYFTPTIQGKNFKYFFGVPYFFALSGGVNNNVQFYSNIVSNSGGVADTAYVPNIMITGSTGYYSIIVQNIAGSATLTGAITALSGINRARSNPGCTATAQNGYSISHESHPAAYAIDGSTGTYASIDCATTASGNHLRIIPNNNGVNNGLINVSLIGIYIQPDIGLKNNARYPTSSGGIALYQNNVPANTPTFYTPIINISGILYDFGQVYTGIRTIRIYSPQKTYQGNDHFMALSEVSIY